MAALLAADVLALVDADFGPAVRAEVEHGARGTGGGGAGGGGAVRVVLALALALAGGGVVAVAVHGWVVVVAVWLCDGCGWRC